MKSAKPGKWVRLVVLAVVVLLVAGGVTWWALAARSDSDGTPRAVAGTIQAMMLSPDEVSSLTGTTLVAGPAANQPGDPLPATPDTCVVAVGPATTSVFAKGWTAFASSTYQDSPQAAEHTVTQVLGIYPDAAKAGAVFKTLSDGVSGCPAAVRTGQDQQTSAWIYSVETSTSDTLVWTATQDSGDGWACYRQARLKGGVVFEVAVCQAGDGAAAAAKIADQAAGRMPN